LSLAQKLLKGKSKAIELNSFYRGGRLYYGLTRLPSNGTTMAVEWESIQRLSKSTNAVEYCSMQQTQATA